MHRITGTLPKNLAVTVAMILTLLWARAVAEGGFISLIPVADGQATDSNLDGAFESNLDTSSILAYLLTSPATSLTPLEIRSALEFDIRPIPFNTQVTSATLFLNLFSAGFSDKIQHAPEIHGYVGDGVIGFEDMVHSNLIAGPFVSNDFGVLQSALRNIDVTSFIQTLLRDQANFAGFMIRTASDAVGSIDSVEEAMAGRGLAPTLTIGFASPIPEPATLTLFAIGLLWAISCRRDPGTRR